MNAPPLSEQLERYLELTAQADSGEPISESEDGKYEVSVHATWLNWNYILGSVKELESKNEHLRTATREQARRLTVVLAAWDELPETRMDNLWEVQRELVALADEGENDG